MVPAKRSPNDIGLLGRRPQNACNPSLAPDGVSHVGLIARLNHPCSTSVDVAVISGPEIRGSGNTDGTLMSTANKSMGSNYGSLLAIAYRAWERSQSDQLEALVAVVFSAF